jgi:hypothetical protein
MEKLCPAIFLMIQIPEAQVTFLTVSLVAYGRKIFISIAWLDVKD